MEYSSTVPLMTSTRMLSNPTSLDLPHLTSILRLSFSGLIGEGPQSSMPTVWHVGDKTVPVALQHDMEHSAKPFGPQAPKDVVAPSTKGDERRSYANLEEKQAADDEAADKDSEVLDSDSQGLAESDGEDSEEDARLRRRQDLRQRRHWTKRDV